MKDVHTEHCCKEHGCKYGNTDCTVEFGGLKQSCPCEMCNEENMNYYSYPIVSNYQKLIERMKLFLISLKLMEQIDQVFKVTMFGDEHIVQTNRGTFNVNIRKFDEFVQTHREVW
jgi:hypothetical protein